MRIFNYANLKNHKWDSEILGLVAQIHEFKGKQELYLKQKPVALEKLVEIAKIQSTEASNKIEGIVTTSTRLQPSMRAMNISRFVPLIFCSSTGIYINIHRRI